MALRLSPLRSPAVSSRSFDGAPSKAFDSAGMLSQKHSSPALTVERTASTVLAGRLAGAVVSTWHITTDLPSIAVTATMRIRLGQVLGVFPTNLPGCAAEWSSPIIQRPRFVPTVSGRDYLLGASTSRGDPSLDVSNVRGTQSPQRAPASFLEHVPYPTGWTSFVSPLVAGRTRAFDRDRYGSPHPGI